MELQGVGIMSVLFLADSQVLLASGPVTLQDACPALFLVKKSGRHTCQHLGVTWLRSGTEEEALATVARVRLIVEPDRSCLQPALPARLLPLWRPHSCSKFGFVSSNYFLINLWFPDTTLPCIPGLL